MAIDYDIVFDLYFVSLVALDFNLFAACAAIHGKIGILIYLPY